MRKPFYLLLCVLLNFPHIPSWMKRNYKWVYLPFIGHSPYLCHGILSPLLPRSWGTILVVLALWYLKFSHREFSHFFFFGEGGGQQGFLYWGDEGSPSPTGQRFTHPSLTRKSPSQQTPPTKSLFPSPKVHTTH